MPKLRTENNSGGFLDTIGKSPNSNHDNGQSSKRHSMVTSEPFNPAALATEATVVSSSPMYISIIWEFTVTSGSCQSSTLQGEERKQVKTSFSHFKSRTRTTQMHTSCGRQIGTPVPRVCLKELRLASVDARSCILQSATGWSGNQECT